MILGLELVPVADGAPVGGWDALAALAPDLAFVAEPPGRDNAAAVAALRGAFGAALVPHLTTRNRTAEDVAARVGHWRGLGVERVMALRGDQVTACDLSRDQRLRSGRELCALLVALDPELEVWVAAYPETHPEATSPAADLRTLRAKQESGAAGAVCQFTFDAGIHLAFRDRARAAGVTLPLLAGVMAPTASRLEFARACGASLPRAVVDAASRFADRPADLAAWGEAHAVGLAEALVAGGVDGLQVFTFNEPAPARAIAALR